VAILFSLFIYELRIGQVLLNKRQIYGGAPRVNRINVKTHQDDRVRCGVWVRFI